MTAVAARAWRRLDLSTPIFAAVALLLCVLVFFPVAYLVGYAFTDDKGAFTLANFIEVFTDPEMVGPLVITFVIATSVGVLCCLVAAPMGWIVSRTDMPARRLVRTLITASFVTPPFLGAVAWEMLAAPNSGLLNQLYRSVLGYGPDAVLFNIYSLSGVIFVIACYTFPYVFVLVANALDRIPGDLEDAAAILGAGTLATTIRITLPLVLPAMLAGALIAFLRAMTLFGSPAILAMPAGFHTLTTKIWSLFQFPPRPGLAAAAALPLLVATVVLLRAQTRILGRRGYAIVGTRGGEPRVFPLGRWKWPALAFCLVVLCNPVLLPYAALLKAAFSQTYYSPLGLDTLTLHNFEFVFLEFSPTRLALRNTLVLCTMAATLGTLLAIVIAYLTVRRAVWGHQALNFLATAPNAIPGIVLGVGLFLAYARPPLALYGTLWIMLLAYLTIELPSSYQQLQAAFKGIHSELEDAGRIFGATRLQTLFRITVPLLRPAAVTTWCFIFIDTMRELSAAVMLFTANTVVMSVVIYDLNESNDLGAISVLGLTMLVSTAVIVGLANRFQGSVAGARVPARSG